MLGSLTSEQKASRELADLLWAEFSSLKAADQARLSRYQEFEDEYEGHRDHRIDELNDYGREVGRRQQVRRHQIKMPYAHPITAKHAFRIAGQMPDLMCERRDASPPERFRADTIEKMLYAAYGRSDASLQFASGAHDGSLLGAGCFDLYWDVDRQLPYFRSIYPGGVLVVQGTEDPHDFKRAYRFWHVSKASFRVDYANHDFPGGEDVADVKCDEGLQDKITLVRFSDSEKTVTMAGGVILTNKTHNYGFTPYVVVPNLGPVRKVWGYGDYEFYRHVARYFEVAISRQADIIRAVANGAYIDENTGQPAANIREALAKGGIIPSRKDGKLTPVEVAQVPNFVDSHFQVIRQTIDDLGFTPPAAWGAIGAASGSDRALQMAPQVELTALKQIHWSSGLKRLNRMMLQLIESKTIGRATYTGEHQRRRVTTPFSITLDAAASEQSAMLDKDGSPILGPNGEPYLLPSTPKDVIAGEYETRVVWHRRIDRDDPTYILAELNKFAQGAQSLYTTLTNLGIESPEDEMKLIEDEAERFPWLRQGMIALIQQQLDAQAQGGGGGDITGALGSLVGGGGGMSGALGFDAGSRGLNGSDNGGGKTAGRVSGAPYGGA